MKPRILLIGLNSEIAAAFKSALEADGFAVTLNQNRLVPGRVPRTGDFDLAAAFWEIPSPVKGDACAGGFMDALFLSGNHSVSNRIRMFQDGVYHVHAVEEETRRFAWIAKQMLVGNVIESEKISRLNEWFLKGEGNPLPVLRIVGENPKIRELRRKIALISRFPDKPVLITGETGTGKELVAESLHQLSPRSGKAFFRINCSAIPENLIESQLFGHRKGAFTGAFSSQTGIFEAADGGTVLLDEIGEMKVSMQPKLLRVLESGTFHRVGDTEEVKVDVWVIASTNADLEDRVRQELFRKDLYYRLNAVKLMIPPLRERKEDIPLLIEAFAAQLHMDAAIIKPSIREHLIKCRWDGNVRELKNVVEGLLMHGDEEIVDLKELVPENDRKTKAGRDDGDSTLENAEKDHVLKVYYTHGKKIMATASALKIDIKTLRKKLIRYGVYK